MNDPPRTARWIHEWITDPSGDEGGPHHHLSENWLRLDPPAHAWRSEYGEHDVIDERGHLHTAESWANCLLSPHLQPLTVEDYLAEILPWGVGSGPSAAWEQAPDTLDGRAVLRCRREVAEGDFRVEYLAWLEPASGLLLRKEQIDRDPRTGRAVQHSIERDYQYNVEPPPGTFVLPPPDKPLVEVDPTDRLTDILPELPPAEVDEIQAAIAASNQAWAGGDFEQFCRVWHFLKSDKTGPLPGRTEWEAALQARPERTIWTSEITAIIRGDFIGVHIGVNTGSSVPAPDVLWVKSQLRVEWSEAGYWEGDAEYTLQQLPEGYRLVYWTYPSEEIREALKG